jgi:Tfp pilus assembly protein PilN
MMEDPTKQTPPEPRAALPLRGARELFDINILPDRFRRKKLSLASILPWLILAVLLGTIYPTYQLAIQEQSAFRDNRLALARVQAELDFYQTSSQEQEDLQNQIDDALAQKDAIILSFGGLKFSNIKWSPTLFQINQLLPEGVSWVQISQQNESIQLDGYSAEYQRVINLLDSLKSLDNLGSVEISSIEQMDPEEGSVTAPDSEPPPVIYRFTILTNLVGEVLP